MKLMEVNASCANRVVGIRGERYNKLQELRIHEGHSAISVSVCHVSAEQ